MPEPTWTAGLFPQGGADELQAAERRVALLKIELEAIRSGRKEASAAELRKLERHYREAVAEVGRLRAAQAPPRPTEPRPERGMPELRRLWEGRAAAGAPGSGAAAGREYAAGAPAAPASLGQAWQRRPRVQAGPGVQPPGAIPGASAAAFGQGPPRRTMTPQVLGGLTGGPQGMIDLATQRLGLDRLRPTGQAGLPGGAGEMTEEEWLAQQRQMSDYEKAMMDWRNRSLAQEGRMTQYQMGQLGQGQQQMRATALWRQQQQAHDTAQLKQAWMVAQAELAHAQNVMASQIGTSLSQQQGQQWAQGLPHALRQGTQVAPGFERGGPMSQLYRMSGSQFRPGRTGRISPSPPPSLGQTMGWVQQAMGQFGAGG